MDHRTLQLRLRDRDCDPGPVDGRWGPLTRGATLKALTDGTDNTLVPADYQAAANLLRVTPAHVRAVVRVEANGEGFTDGRPTILFEPHRFSRSTGGRFDASHPTISYRKWRTRPYPKTQAARYDQLLDAVGLDPAAGFMSASYGLFQILGENYARCGYRDPFAFAMAQAQSEGDQLEAFVAFVLSMKLDQALRDGHWGYFADRYNGTASAANRYAERLAAAFGHEVGR